MGAIVITGVPGVGKSTVLELAAAETKRPVVVYGTEMLAVAQARGLVKDRDEMRRLPPDLQRQIQEAAADAIRAKGDVIVDTHCTIKTPHGYLPGLPAWVVERLRPSQIILVEAAPEEIAGRRAKDATRKRDADDTLAIAEHQAVNRLAAMAVATLTGATLVFLQNRDGRQDETKRALLSALG
ncbi:MAG TPA: adenylate kinase [Candidatus Thermoplasmatota archaeon]|nr:adenylate kinase [Candidatus Thermoplasmatota archaeon]